MFSKKRQRDYSDEERESVSEIMSQSEDGEDERQEEEGGDDQLSDRDIVRPSSDEENEYDNSDDEEMDEDANAQEEFYRKTRIVYDPSSDDPYINNDLPKTEILAAMMSDITGKLLQTFDTDNEDEKKSIVDKLKKFMNTFQNIIDTYLYTFIERSIPRTYFNVLVHIENLLTVLELVHVVCKTFHSLSTSDQLPREHRIQMRAFLYDHFLTKKLITGLEKVNDHIIVGYIDVRGKAGAIMERDGRMAFWLCICKLKYLFSNYIPKERDIYYNAESGWMNMTATDFFALCSKKHNPEDTSKLRQAIKTQKEDFDRIPYLMYGSFIRGLNVLDRQRKRQLVKEIHLSTGSRPVDNGSLPSGEHDRNTSSNNNAMYERDAQNDGIGASSSSGETGWNLRDYLEFASNRYDATEFYDKPQSNIGHIKIDVQFSNETFSISDKPIKNYTVEDLKFALEKMDAMYLKMERNWAFMAYMNTLWLRCCEVTFEMSDVPEAYDDYVYCKTVHHSSEIEYTDGQINITTSSEEENQTVHVDFLRKTEMILFHYLVFTSSLNLLRHRCMGIELETLFVSEEAGISPTYYNLMENEAFEQFHYDFVDPKAPGAIDLYKKARFMHGIDPTGVPATVKEMGAWFKAFIGYFATKIIGDEVTNIFSRQYVKQFLLPGELEWHSETNAWINEDPSIVLSTARSDEFTRVKTECTRISVRSMMERSIVPLAGQNGRVEGFNIKMDNEYIKYHFICFLILHMIIEKEDVGPEKRKLLPKYWLYFENNPDLDVHYRVLFNKKRKKGTKIVNSRYAAVAALAFGGKDTSEDKSKVTNRGADKISGDTTNFIDHYTVPVIVWSGCAFHLFYGESIYMKFYDIVSAVKNWIIILNAYPPKRFWIPSDLQTIFKNEIDKHVIGFKTLH